MGVCIRLDKILLGDQDRRKIRGELLPTSPSRITMEEEVGFMDLYTIKPEKKDNGKAKCSNSHPSNLGWRGTELRLTYCL
jgi:hypothetical protein